MYLRLSLILAAFVILSLTDPALVQGSDFAGKWTGEWSNSLGESGNDSLVLSEEANGNLSGLWSNEVTVSGQLTGSDTASLVGQTATRDYRIRARVEGDRMTLTYSAARLNAEGSYNGESRFTRIVLDKAQNPSPSIESRRQAPQGQSRSKGQAASAAPAAQGSEALPPPPPMPD